MTIAFIGTGRIGAGLAEAALGRGKDTRVWNRTSAKCEPLVALGATLCKTPADAVKGASRIHLTMTSDEAVDDMVAQLVDDLDSDGVIIDHSTTSPDGTRKRAETLAAHGVAYLHVPVFMSPNACRKALGVMIAAGPRAVFDRVEADLQLMTGQVLYVGEGGSAATLKLAGNCLIVSIVAGLSDAFAIAKNGDVSADAVLGLFEHFDPRSTLRIRGANMAKGDYTTHWSAEMAKKDVGLMRDASAPQALAVLPAIAARLDEIIERGDGDRDIGALAMDVVPPSTSL